MAIYTPGVNGVFKLTPLSILPLLTSLGLAFSIVIIMEIYKLISKGIKK